MTTSFEQRLIDACDRFLAARDRFVTEVLAAAQDASVEAVERAFALASATRSRLVSAPRNEESATAEVAPGVPVPTPELVTAPAVPPEPAPAHSVSASLVPSTSNADRVLACIRQTPGSHVGQLSRTLSMSPSTVRRHVRELAAREAIRIQGASGPWWGQARLTFFPCEPNIGVELSASAPEASA